MNQDEAADWYEKAASNPVGAFIVGTYTSQGIGFRKNEDKGKTLLQKAADAVFLMPI